MNKSAQFDSPARLRHCKALKLKSNYVFCNRCMIKYYRVLNVYKYQNVNCFLYLVVATNEIMFIKFVIIVALIAIITFKQEFAHIQRYVCTMVHPQVSKHDYVTNNSVTLYVIAL